MIVLSFLGDFVSIVFLLAGAFFVLAGAVGVFRLPDFFTRLHGAGVTDTLGAGLVLLGLMIQAGFTLATVKLIMILVFLFVTGPTSCHALAQASLALGMRPDKVSE